MAASDGFDRIFIIGAGAWGTALAQTLARVGREVVLWAHDPATAAAINRDRANAAFLPGLALAAGIRATAALDEAAAADLLLFAPPAQHLRELAAALAPSPASCLPAVVCSKGIEIESGALLSEVLAETLPAAPLAVLSGPTFAAEVARGLPTAVTLACRDAALGQRLVTALGSRTFRPYLAADPVGAEIGGAVKNVLAIACGIVLGRGLGENARASLITRGLAEMVRLAVAKGGRPATLMGLSGLGDLTLTCTSAQSRNFSLGLALGEGRALDAVLAGRRSVAEGVTSAPAAVALARRLGIEMPIAVAVDSILHHGAAIDAVVAALLARPFRSENAIPP
ncbi:MAG TPA: NAD(P)H-dependent glycerol-3-phosphate dehydrogenase [Stellaceae bacterium]|nr:NAD(P)H-dependent glycerol-3-phosphate dehydrogenase [Stellaceae bacterium]